MKLMMDFVTLNGRLQLLDVIALLAYYPNTQLLRIKRYGLQGHLKRAYNIGTFCYGPTSSIEVIDNVPDISPLGLDIEKGPKVDLPNGRYNFKQIQKARLLEEETEYPLFVPLTEFI